MHTVHHAYEHVWNTHGNAVRALHRSGDRRDERVPHIKGAAAVSRGCRSRAAGARKARKARMWTPAERAKLNIRTEIIDGLDLKPLVITDVNSAVGIEKTTPQFVVGAKFRVRETAQRTDAHNRRVTLHARAPDGKWFVRFDHLDFDDVRFPNAAGVGFRSGRARRHPHGLAFSEAELMDEDEYKRIKQQRAEAKHERRCLGKRLAKACFEFALSVGINYDVARAAGKTASRRIVLNDDNLPPPFPHAAWDKKASKLKSTPAEVGRLFKVLDAPPPQGGDRVVP